MEDGGGGSDPGDGGPAAAGVAEVPPTLSHMNLHVALSVCPLCLHREREKESQAVIKHSTFFLGGGGTPVGGTRRKWFSKYKYDTSPQRALGCERDPVVCLGLHGALLISALCSGIICNHF